MTDPKNIFSVHAQRTQNFMIPLLKSDHSLLEWFLRVKGECVLPVRHVIESLIKHSSEGVCFSLPFQRAVIDRLEPFPGPLNYRRTLCKLYVDEALNRGHDDFLDDLVESALPPAATKVSESTATTAAAAAAYKRFQFPPAVDRVVARVRHDFGLANTGLAQWDAGLVLAEYFSQQHQLQPAPPDDHERVLELGSGLGVAGIVFARANAATCKNVVLTDGDQEVVQNLDHNVTVNASSGTPLPSISVAQLDWTHPWFTGNDDDGCEDPPDVVTDLDSQPPTLIFAADVLYDPRVIEPFVKCLAKLMSHWSGHVAHALVATIERNPDTVQFAANCFHSHGLHMQSLDTAAIQPTSYCKHRNLIKLYKITL